MNGIKEKAFVELDELSTDEQQESNVIELNQFLTEFGAGLMTSVSKQHPPVYDGTPNTKWDKVMDHLKRQPFPAQRERVQAVCKLLSDENESAAILNGEMGCGKTMMGIAVSASLFDEGYRRTLVISPPHLVYKWKREILETIQEARVWVLNGPDTLRQLIKIKETVKTKPAVPEFFIIGRVRMRMGFDWQPVAIGRNAYQRNITAETESQPARSYLTVYQYAACVNCGNYLTNQDNEKISLAYFLDQTDRRQDCKFCQAPLWTLKRASKAKNPEQLIHKEMCKIPTIGPKTADKLISNFGSEMLASMLGDKIHDFINLMDDQGELVFSDRQAKRMERGLAKQVFSFGQGGYQPSEFIKRYLPDGFFDLLLVDEGHEYKNSGSAQGQAMAVLAAKARKTILLTGTLMGGYADDIFYLLWRILPGRMIEDGYVYNNNNNLGPAAMSFMRQHGVLKDVFKETDGGSHRTAKGKRTTVHTSKAPGFGPKGVIRYILPYTAFLKLSQIGNQVLPEYQEHFIDIEMTEDQANAYRSLALNLTDELKRALGRGDKTLMGLVLTVLLAWSDTCFREETVRHPRSKELLAYVPAIFAENELSPKEEKLIELCYQNKRQGRKVLVYTVYTGKRDTASRLKKVLESKQFKVAVLRSTVSTDSREDWISDQVDQGIDILICNPELVKTGLDLLDFPSIYFMQSGYNVYTVSQASRRSWRIGQTQAVEVGFLGYAKTAQISCLELMAKKIAVSQSTSGDMPETGLDVLNSDGDSIEMALAKQLIAA